MPPWPPTASRSPGSLPLASPAPGSCVVGGAVCEGTLSLELKRCSDDLVPLCYVQEQTSTNVLRTREAQTKAVTQQSRSGPEGAFPARAARVSAAPLRGLSLVSPVWCRTASAEAGLVIGSCAFSGRPHTWLLRRHVSPKQLCALCFSVHVLPPCTRHSPGRRGSLRIGACVRVSPRCRPGSHQHGVLH